MIYSKKYKKAFGLIEVLISIAIIAIIMAALVGITNMVLTNSVRAQERAQAVRLAQEGIEIVRQIRDTGWIDRDNETQWDTLAFESSKWIVAPDPSGGSSDYEIAFSSSNPDYRYYLKPISGSGEEISLDKGATKFQRKITVANVGSLVPKNGNTEIRDYAKKVTVTVMQPSGKSVVISEVMTNWRPNF